MTKYNEKDAREIGLKVINYYVLETDPITNKVNKHSHSYDIQAFVHNEWIPLPMEEQEREPGLIRQNVYDECEKETSH